MGCNSLKGMAKSGIPPVNPILIISGHEYPLKRPIGNCHGLILKYSHACKSGVQSLPLVISQPYENGFASASPNLNWNMISVPSNRAIRNAQS
jgi:hypothetical protein